MPDQGRLFLLVVAVDQLVERSDDLVQACAVLVADVAGRPGQVVDFSPSPAMACPCST
jgi:hypothetical protein